MCIKNHVRANILKLLGECGSDEATYYGGGSGHWQTISQWSKGAGFRFIFRGGNAFLHLSCYFWIKRIRNLTKSNNKIQSSLITWCIIARLFGNLSVEICSVKMWFTSKNIIVIVITFYASFCFGQETAKGLFDPPVKLPHAHLSTTQVEASHCIFIDLLQLFLYNCTKQIFNLMYTAL